MLPEFQSLITQYDIFVCLEAKIDHFDKLELPDGYEYTAKIRKKFVRASGGIVFIYKEFLKPVFKFHDNDSEFVLWATIQNTLDKENDFLLGCIYIPPENSKYTSSDAFIEIETELTSFMQEHNKCAVIGDFNARSGTLQDYTIPDDHLLQILQLDEENEVLDGLYDFKILDTANAPLGRYSNDQGHCNNYGYKLIEFCKNNNLFIVNGRVGKDKMIGKVTSKDTSTVDYLITSANLFSFISEFEVMDFDPLMSDAHCRIHVSILFNKESIVNKTSTKENCKVKPVRWVEEKKVQFTECVETKFDNISEFMRSVDTVNTSSKSNIEEIVTKINSIFCEAANETFGNKTVGLKPLRKNSKHWFNSSCHVKRKEFHRAKKNHNVCKSDESRYELKVASKAYKFELNKCYQEEQYKLEQDLRKKSKSEPKELWKILNSFNNSKNTPKITIDKLYEHFKNLNMKSDAEDFCYELPEIENGDEILNGEITEEEIICAIKDLKNGKAPGCDDVVNEYIKSTKDLFMPLYLKLFNLILDSGVIPEIWLSGIIVPIYKNRGDPSNPDSYRGITLLSCVGKLFTSILNTRLSKYADLLEIIPDSQAGFRKGYSTLDNIFCLHVLVEIYLSFGYKLFCTFVDFRKAFDTVWRVGLWQKLLKSKISGKILKVIYNMYENIKSCVRVDDEISGFFVSEIGVRQGENLSPFLFSIFLSDLEDFFVENGISGLSKITSIIAEII